MKGVNFQLVSPDLGLVVLLGPKRAGGRLSVGEMMLCTEGQCHDDRPSHHKEVPSLSWLWYSRVVSDVRST
jgi:hypothetical protein